MFFSRRHRIFLEGCLETDFLSEYGGFQKYCSRADLVRMKTMNMGSLYKLTYDVTLKAGIKEKDFLDEIRVKNCNLKVLLSHPCLEEEI